MSRVQRVEELLLQLQPSHLEVTDFSHGHNVQAGSESHLKVVIAGDIFDGEDRSLRTRLFLKKQLERLEAKNIKCFIKKR